MIDRIRLRENVACEVLPDGVVFVSENGSRLLTGRTEQLVAGVLDGSSTLDTMIERLAGKASAAEVCFVVERLQRDGLVVSGACLADPERGWEAQGAGAETLGRLSQAEFEIVQIGDVGAWAVEAVAAGLRSLAPRVGAGCAGASALRVVVADDYLRNALSDFNAESLSSGRSWLLVKPAGVEAWVGPFFVPGQTGCWRCLAQRLRGHRRVDEYLRRRKGAEDVTTAALAGVPSVAGAAAGLAATAAGNWIVHGQSGLEGAVWTLDARALDWKRHSLLKRPQCSACGEAAPPRDGGSSEAEARARNSSSLKLVSRRADSVDGGWRVASPDQTFDRIKHHISPVTGIVGDLIDLSVDRGAEQAVAPSFLATHAFTADAHDIEELRYSLQRVAGGKGVTSAQARTGAVCEALERYSGVFDGTETVVRARMTELGDQAIHPNASMLFSDRQLNEARAARTAANPDRKTVVLPPGARRVPARFDPDAEIDWTPIWSLTHARVKYLPTAYCYYGAGRLDPALDRVLDRFADVGRETWTLDVTTDLGIPTFAAVSGNAALGRSQILLGFGAHLDAKVALRRAVTELVQSFPAVREGESRSSSPEHPQSAAFGWFATAAIDDHPYLVPDPVARALTPADYPQKREVDLLDAIGHCVERARECGLETLALDQTRPDVGLAAVKVFVPGLRHFWPRFCEGRLYEVPVKLGWRTRILEEDELNPVPIYF
jgi:bacteriocin biosynthesis cyclodehydratase domain-containing protein